MEQYILNVLSGYGLAGLIILALGWTVLQQMKKADTVNESRLNERDAMLKIIAASTAAQQEAAKAIASRNEATEELVKAFEKQALVFELFMQQMKSHDDGFKDKLGEFKVTIESIAEAMRSMTGTLRSIRDDLDPPLPRRGR